MNFEIETLLKAGAHFGHQVKRWSPKMKSYIFTKRNGVHIINLDKTLEALEKVEEYLTKEIKEGKKIIFVGTKKQARETIEKEALRCGAMYINNRWPGGLISNFSSVKNTIEKYNHMIEQKGNGEFDKMSKKEQSVFNKDFERKEKLVGGIKDLTKKPDILFILDVKREEIAIKEANREDIPIIAICDTNSDPNLVTYPIPGNDDAVKSINLFVSFIADVIKKNQKETISVPSKEFEKKEEKKPAEKKPQTETKEESGIEKLNLPKSLEEKLKKAGIEKVNELRVKKEAELKAIKGVGESAIKRIEKELEGFKK